MIIMYEKELKAAQEAADKAGKILMKYHRKTFEIMQKETDQRFVDLVTTADFESEKAIISLLKKKFPEYGILAEESGISEKESTIRWIIDPLDGTHNFSKGSEIFGVSIGLEVEGEIMVGVLNFPKLNEKAYAVRGKGAFFDKKKIHVSTIDDARSSVHIGGVRKIAHDEKAKERFIGLIKRYPSIVRLPGAAIYSLSAVASGRAEAYVDIGLKPWDIAAGGLIVEEAGGKVTNTSGEKWNAHQKGFVISNGLLHNELLNFFK